MVCVSRDVADRMSLLLGPKVQTCRKRPGPWLAVIDLSGGRLLIQRARTSSDRDRNRDCQIPSDAKGGGATFVLRIPVDETSPTLIGNRPPSTCRSCGGCWSRLLARRPGSNRARSRRLRGILPPRAGARRDFHPASPARQLRRKTALQTCHRSR